MNIDEAISKHVLWKQKLAVYLARPDQSLSPSELALDDRCALGRWLHCEAGSHAGKAEYEDVVRKHAHFHMVTAELVRSANSGRGLSEDVVLGAFIECEEASIAVVRALTALRRTLQNSGP